MLVALAAWLVSRQLWLTAEGLVVSDDVVVAAPFRARVESVPVRCNRRVEAGQPLITLKNEALHLEMQQDVIDLQRQLERERAQAEVDEKQIEVARQEIVVARSKLKEDRSLAEMQQKLWDRGYTTRPRWETAVAAAEQSAAALEAATARLAAREKELSGRRDLIALYQRQIADALGDGGGLVTTTLTAPAGGILTLCGASQGESVAANERLFMIFDPATAYVKAFVRPSRLDLLTVGETVRLAIDGFENALTGRVASFDQAVTELPPSLIRYFWEEANWSQYVPVNIDIVGIAPDQAARLRYGAHVTVDAYGSAWP